MTMTSSLSNISVHIGRIALASLFFLGGINKLFSYDATLGSMDRVGLVPNDFLLPMVIALELVGGVAVAIGRSLAVLSAFLLAAFTIATNYFFHDFWNMTGSDSAVELSLFFKNLAIAGALLYVGGTLSVRSET